MSLTRLLANQGRLGEACAMLAKIYGWFTQGFDTADLKDAKGLLDGLNPPLAAPAHLNGRPPRGDPRLLRIP
jgi:hypothetical protein